MTAAQVEQAIKEAESRMIASTNSLLHTWEGKLGVGLAHRYATSGDISIATFVNKIDFLARLKAAKDGDDIEWLLEKKRAARRSPRCVRRSRRARTGSSVAARCLRSLLLLLRRPMAPVQAQTRCVTS